VQRLSSKLTQATCRLPDGVSSFPKPPMAPRARDGNAVIVRRGSSPSKPQFRGFPLPSLQTDGPRDLVAKRVTSIGN
jgi:hypothetical protein